MQLKLKSVESRQNDMAEQSNRENMRLRDRIRQLEDQITTMSNEMGDMERSRALDWTDVSLLDQQFNNSLIIIFQRSTLVMMVVRMMVLVLCLKESIR